MPGNAFYEWLKLGSSNISTTHGSKSLMLDHEFSTVAIIIEEIGDPNIDGAFI